MPSYRIEIAKQAQKQLRRLPVRVQENIAEKIAILGINPVNPGLDIKRLVNNPLGEFRLRVGNYRVIFNRDDTIRIIQIILIGHRKLIYK
ncbi:MAG: hypothetical protein A2W69_05105 [Gammaproteobacteria bacterium RIFCSPLOWO2_02_47_7]|nr:MAG: hypothetical protein A2W69_05105 [Gammaproteobacteria bacterium RIFCSPLOWO2_02_47_7]OGT75091.1 MAG: hypothetical protein A2W76_00615 [Gammaproteobacteria bacterium RIFCSPLOWO2_12_47_11]